MRRTLLLLSLLGSVFPSFAQTALPYYTGFDNTAEKAGWVEFRKGVTTTFNWGVGMSTIAASAPNVLNHDYPVGATTADTTIDWYVSPPFQFPAGGTLDSLKINLYAITGSTTPSDSLVVYLLVGSNNPTTATSKIRLADLTKMATSATIMKDTGNFTIPPITGSGYLAFKYQAVQNWFVPNIDNIHISKNPSVGIKNVNEHSGSITVFPNPAQNTVQISFTNSRAKKATIWLIDVTGQRKIVQSVDHLGQSASIDVSQLPAGIYTIQIITDLDEHYSEKITIVK